MYAPKHFLGTNEIEKEEMTKGEDTINPRVARNRIQRGAAAGDAPVRYIRARVRPNFEPHEERGRVHPPAFTGLGLEWRSNPRGKQSSPPRFLVEHTEPTLCAQQSSLRRVCAWRDYTYARSFLQWVSVKFDISPPAGYTIKEARSTSAQAPR